MTVCMYILQNQPFYACGHTVCLHCMRSCDEATQAPFMNSLTVYKCPVCRHETLTPWFDRPRNLVVQSLCEAHEDYRTRSEESRRHTCTERGSGGHEGRSGFREDIVLYAGKEESGALHELAPCSEEPPWKGRRMLLLLKQRK